MRFADYMHLHAMQIHAKMHVLHLAEIGKKIWCIWGPNGPQCQWKTFVNAQFKIRPTFYQKEPAYFVNAQFTKKAKRNRPKSRWWSFKSIGTVCSAFCTLSKPIAHCFFYGECFTQMNIVQSTIRSLSKPLKIVGVLHIVSSIQSNVSSDVRCV